MMRDTLLRELAVQDGLELLTAHDSRLPAPQYAQSIPVSPEADVWQIWQSRIDEADAAWVVAPESEGLLYRLTSMVESRGKVLLGCPSAAVELAGSKLATYRTLTAAGIPCVPSWRGDVWLQQPEAGIWVVKPDDGVSCEGCRCFSDIETLRQWLEGRECSYIIQPWRDGIAASLSMLCRDGHAWLLSCNRQVVRRDGNGFRFEGCEVNGLKRHWDMFARLAAGVSAAIPALNGYVGVDLMLTEGDDEVRLEVLEVNPRLTTSYAGLGRVTGINVSAQVMALVQAQNPSAFRLPPLSGDIVEVTL
ncbi:MAG TPA: ATP-grasp domain-containing protein [Methylophilaceae bacterium]